MATKQLLETLTQWSRHNATEAEVSDVYVRLGYEFNIACRAFTAIGVEVTDLGNVPDLLRTILEDTLSQEASPQSLDRYLPRIRDIIINLLHGLKRKQQRLRQKQARDGTSPSGLADGRSSSIGSGGSGETGLSDMLNESQRAAQPSYQAGHIEFQEPRPPPRVSSVPRSDSPIRQDQLSTEGRSRASITTRDNPSAYHTANSSISGITLPDPTQSQNHDAAATFLNETPSEASPTFTPPPPPPKQQDALAALQRGGDLERRASRRYSAYQIQKHLGATNGVPMLPPVQNSPIPNRGREARESMTAVRTRGSFMHTKQRSTNSISAESPNSRPNEAQAQDGSSLGGLPQDKVHDESPITKSSNEKLGVQATKGVGNDEPLVSATMSGPLDIEAGDGVRRLDGDEIEKLSDRRSGNRGSSRKNSDRQQYGDNHTETLPEPQFIPDQSPQPGKELTLFLQYKSKIKKFVFADGYNELTIPRLQLAFIEKFAWNTHSNGNELPEIYIQDSVSGVRHELEDLNDVKDRSVLVLNVEVLDEVKKHIDEGLGDIRTLVEGVRSVVDLQQSALQRVSDRQQSTAKDMARMAAAPTASQRASMLEPPLGSGPSVGTSPVGALQLGEVQDLRRDLAVMRQTYSGFVSDIEASMTAIKKTAGTVKATAIKAVVPDLEGAAGRTYLNTGREAIVKESSSIVERVEDLQDLVEDLRRDVVTRGVRPLPRQLETVGRDIASMTTEIKKFQEQLKREKPIWTKIWEQELAQVCEDRKELDVQEEICIDLESDVANAAEIFALVEQHTKQLMSDNNPAAQRSTSRGLNPIPPNDSVDPHMAKEGVLGEVRALAVNHENRLEAIQRAEKARRKELESRRGGEFQKELGSFVGENRLKKTGGAEEIERLRKAKDDKIRKEVWDRMNGIVSPEGDASLAPPVNEGNTVSPEPEFVEAEEHPELQTNGIS